MPQMTVPPGGFQGTQQYLEGNAVTFSTHELESGFTRKLRRGELVVGTWINALKDPVIAKIIGSAGFDYMLIDAEHSGATMASLSEMCLLARECGVLPLIRPTDPEDVKNNGRLLDAGAMGILASHIESAAQARMIANSLRYFNGGTRGCNTRSIFSGFAKMTEESMRKADEDVICVVSFESPEAVAQADDILAVPGVDIAIIGRGDLSHNLGVSGDPDNSAVTAMVERVFAAAARQKKTAGLLVNNAEEAKWWVGKGARFVSLGSEVGWLLNAYQANIQAARTAYAVGASAS